MKVIAIRHGEIELNTEGRTTGWLDVDLSPIGIKQAVQLAQNMKGGFKIIISSPLLRALNTAKIISNVHLCQIVQDKNLRERNFGCLNGKTWAEIHIFHKMDALATYRLAFYMRRQFHSMPMPL